MVGIPTKKDRKGWRGSLCGLVVVAVFVAGAGPSTRPFLVEEVPFLNLEPGQHFELLGRYQSCVGRTLTVEGCALTFEIEDQSVSNLLRNPKLRAGRLLFRVAVRSGPTAQPVLTVGRIQPAPTAEKFFHEVSAELDSLSLDRRVVIAQWVLDSSPDADRDLVRAGQIALLKAFKEQANRSIQEDDPNLHWIGGGEKYLTSDPDWHDFLLDFADRWGSRPAVETRLRRHGLIRDFGGWRREADLFAEVGMVRAKDRIVTIDRHLLEVEIEGWNPTPQDITMLRGFTQKQYELFARLKEVHRGMHRDEVVGSWGYPERVTWLRRKNFFYEAWMYPDRWICLVEGKVFRWQEGGTVKGLSRE